MDLSNVQCFHCHQYRHCTSDCTVLYDEIAQVQMVATKRLSTNTKGDKLEEVQFRMMEGVMMSLQQHTKQAVSNTWVLLDSASTINVFVNPQLVSNIRSRQVHTASAFYVQSEQCTLIKLLISKAMVQFGFFQMASPISSLFAS